MAHGGSGGPTGLAPGRCPQVFAGSITQENLRLRPEAFEALDIPIRIVSGYLKRSRPRRRGLPCPVSLDTCTHTS